jgi:hypothetical protein
VTILAAAERYQALAILLGIDRLWSRLIIDAATKCSLVFARGFLTGGSESRKASTDSTSSSLKM